MKSAKQIFEAYVREKLGLKTPLALPLPVKYDGMTYFWGANNEMIADSHADIEDDLLRIRGWGRIQYVKEEDKTPEELQDEAAHWIADAINAYAEIQLHHVLRVLGGHVDIDSYEIENNQIDITLFQYDVNDVRVHIFLPLTPPSEWEEETFEALNKLLGL